MFLRRFRDCGSALAVGGGSIALTLLLSGSYLRLRVFVAFSVINGLLLIGTALFSWRAGHWLGFRVPRLVVVSSLMNPLLLIVASLVLLSSTQKHQWPVAAFTGIWWVVIGLSLWAAAWGVSRRHRAEEWLEQLAER